MFVCLSVPWPRWPRGRGEQSLPSCCGGKVIGMSQRRGFCSRDSSIEVSLHRPHDMQQRQPWWLAAKLYGGKRDLMPRNKLSSLQAACAPHTAVPLCLHGRRFKRPSGSAPVLPFPSPGPVSSLNTKAGSCWITVAPPCHPSRLGRGDSSQPGPLPFGSIQTVA